MLEKLKELKNKIIEDREIRYEEMLALRRMEEALSLPDHPDEKDSELSKKKSENWIIYDPNTNEYTYGSLEMEGYMDDCPFLRPEIREDKSECKLRKKVKETFHSIFGNRHNK